MGSGKGKTRRTSGLQPGSRITSGAPQLRAQTQKTTWSPPPYIYEDSFDKWTEFVHDSGLEGTNYFKYYLGDDYSVNNSATWTVPNMEKAFNELFEDAVAIGAIELPQSYVAEDFLIKMNLPGMNAGVSTTPTAA